MELMSWSQEPVWLPCRGVPSTWKPGRKRQCGPNSPEPLCHGRPRGRLGSGSALVTLLQGAIGVSSWGFPRECASSRCLAPPSSFHTDVTLGCGNPACLVTALMAHVFF